MPPFISVTAVGNNIVQPDPSSLESLAAAKIFRDFEHLIFPRPDDPLHRVMQVLRSRIAEHVTLIGVVVPLKHGSLSLSPQDLVVAISRIMII